MMKPTIAPRRAMAAMLVRRSRAVVTVYHTETGLGLHGQTRGSHYYSATVRKLCDALARHYKVTDAIIRRVCG